MKWFFAAFLIMMIFCGKAQQDSVYSNLEEALQNAKAVKVLVLKRQKLTEFPDSALRTFPNLKELNLSGNRIKRLPEDIAYLGRLERMDLSFNALSELPYSLYSLKMLQWLSLSGNHLLDISAEIRNLRSLKILDVRGKQLHGLKKKEIQQFFEQKVKVKKSPGCNC